MTDDRYRKLPTGPVDITVAQGPDLDHLGAPEQPLPAGTHYEATGATSTVSSAPVYVVNHPARTRRGRRARATAPRRREPRLAPWALMSAIVALVASFFVGWSIPVAVVSVIAAISALRQPQESRALSVWALVLGSLATIYSAGWLVWAAYRFGLFG